MKYDYDDSILMALVCAHKTGVTYNDEQADILHEAITKYVGEPRGEDVEAIREALEKQYLKETGKEYKPLYRKVTTVGEVAEETQEAWNKYWKMEDEWGAEALREEQEWLDGYYEDNEY